MTADLTNPIFTDEEAAREHLKACAGPMAPNARIAAP